MSHSSKKICRIVYIPNQKWKETISQDNKKNYSKFLSSQLEKNKDKSKNINK